MPIGIFKSAAIGERVWPVSGYLSQPFLTQFPRTRCYIKECGFGNKMFISELFTAVGYFHTADFKKPLRNLLCQVHISRMSKHWIDAI